MEKFSLYEVLSFLIPGFLLVSIFQLYHQHVFGCESLINTNGEFGKNLILVCISLFAGIMLHVVNSWLLELRFFKWMQNKIYPDVQVLCANNEFVTRVIPYLNQEYKRLRKHDEPDCSENIPAKNLFDFAYYYLEVNNKIAAAKSFQSLYFWFRNMYVLSFLLLPISIAIVAIALLGDYKITQSQWAIKIALLNLVLPFLIRPIAVWLRKKMIDKVFWGYYLERVHKQEININQ